MGHGRGAPFRDERVAIRRHPPEALEQGVAADWRRRHAILKYVWYLSVSIVKYGTNTRSRPAIIVRYA